MLLLICFAIAFVFAILFFKSKNATISYQKQIENLKTELSASRKDLDDLSLEFIKVNNQTAKSSTGNSLNGLVDEATFDDRSFQALQQNKRYHMSFSIMLLDIEFPAGFTESTVKEELNLEIARRLCLTIREVDSVVKSTSTRYKFLFPQLSKPEDTAYIAQRLIDCLQPAIKIVDQEIFLSATMGIVVCPLDGTSMDALMVNVEASAYQAKSSGKNLFKFYQKELDVRSQREVSIHSFIKSANIKDALVMQYQPVKDIRTDKVYCLQLTPLLIHPEYGHIEFEDFLRIAENIGRINEINEWTLETGLDNFKQWQSQNVHPNLLIIKLAFAQIESPVFLEKITSKLDELHIHSNQIVFEIVASTQTSKNFSIEKLQANLAKTTIQLAISIFAMGNLAIQNISKLPVNHLLIDSNLINDSIKQKQNELILHSIIDVAKKMNIKIIAQGIENVAQVDVLQKLDCHLMQGKYVGQPLKSEQIAELKNI